MASQIPFGSNNVYRVLKSPAHKLPGKCPFIFVRMIRSAPVNIINPSWRPVSLCEVVHSFGDALKYTNEEVVIASANSRKL